MMDRIFKSYRFHVLGIPHTITTPEYSSCAFTAKVVKLCKMLRMLGHHVIHYGHQDSVVDCDEHVTVTTPEDIEQSFPGHDWRKDGWPPYTAGDNISRVFNALCIREISKRKQKNDFLLCSFGGNHKLIADNNPDMLVCEPGIGYPDGAFAPYQVYESYAALHAYEGMEAVKSMAHDFWYKSVIPNYFDLSEFEFKSEKEDYFLFLGRICDAKGAHIAVQIAEELGKKIIIAGMGTISQKAARTPKPISKYVTQVGVVSPTQRKALLSGARAVLCPSLFIEPFCGVQIEAMLSGTPVISTDRGAFAEYNIHGVTGYRCRTFEQFTWAADNVEKISSVACREWGENFSLENIAPKFDEYFFSVMNLATGAGWYEQNPNRRDLDWLLMPPPGSRQ